MPRAQVNLHDRCSSLRRMSDKRQEPVGETIVIVVAKTVPHSVMEQAQKDVADRPSQPQYPTATV
jgi:hypothetical protein